MPLKEIDTSKSLTTTATVEQPNVNVDLSSIAEIVLSELKLKENQEVTSSEINTNKRNRSVITDRTNQKCSSEPPSKFAKTVTKSTAIGKTNRVPLSLKRIEKENQQLFTTVKPTVKKFTAGIIPVEPFQRKIKIKSPNAPLSRRLRSKTISTAAKATNKVKTSNRVPFRI